MSMALQGLKHGYSLTITTATNGATLTTDAIDTAGYDELQCVVVTSASNAVSNNFSVMKIQTSDASGSGYTDLSGYVGDTDFTIADAETATPYLCVLNVDLRGKKRYFKVSISPTTTQNIGVISALARASVTPNAASDGVNTLANP